MAVGRPRAFGDRKYRMDGRPASEYSNFEINLRPVPKPNAVDIKQLAKTYKKVMQDPKVAELNAMNQRYTLASGFVAFVFVLVIIYWSSLA